VKGIILAGGTGSRLLPLTKVTNKHLLPVYDQPMIYYPLTTLINTGLTDIMIVSGRGHAGHFLELLGDGQDFGVRLSYTVQERPGGIAQALGLCKEFVGMDDCFVILGDNIFENHFRADMEIFISDRSRLRYGAACFLKEMDNASRYGVAEVSGKRIVSIEEKPKKPKSKLAIVGAYIFNSSVFSFIKQLKPSHRGELEITDLLRAYMENDALQYGKIGGYWLDAGEIESLWEASNTVRAVRRIAGGK